MVMSKRRRSRASSVTGVTGDDPGVDCGTGASGELMARQCTCGGEAGWSGVGLVSQIGRGLVVRERLIVALFGIRGNDFRAV